jgi:hypothetical protein
MSNISFHVKLDTLHFTSFQLTNFSDEVNALKEFVQGLSGELYDTWHLHDDDHLWCREYD